MDRVRDQDRERSPVCDSQGVSSGAPFGPRPDPGGIEQMPTRFSFLSLTVLLFMPFVAGCASSSGSEVVESGVLYSVSYMQADGHTAGFTRVNSSKAVPGGNGSWNVDAYGRLTRDFLIITRPQHKDLEAEAIPVSRLVDVQFGD